MRRYAVPQNSNNTVQCGYWIKWMSGRVICAVVPCTVYRSQHRLADRSRLDAALPEPLLSEFATSPSECTPPQRTGCTRRDGSDEWYKGIGRARRRHEKAYSNQVLNFPCIIQDFFVFVSSTDTKQYELFYRKGTRNV